MSISEEAKRCLKCKSPRCAKFCPVDTPIPEIMNLFLDGKIIEAGRILFENNPLSAVTSIVCPHEYNCAGHCVLGIKGLPVEFYEIERYISNFYLNYVTMTPPPSNGCKVAVIGAGPAGIAMSIILALRGFDITLIEAKEYIGGVLRFGIPDFRLPKDIISRYDKVLYDLGVKFKPNTFIGANVTIEDMLIDGYKAVFISVGTAKPRKLGLLGETLGHVHYAIDFLRSPATYHLGKNIAVIGAGNVAIDAARMAVRMNPGANVTIINRNREDDMTMNKHELEMAEIDGVEFRHLLSTVRICDDYIVCAKVDAIEGEDGKIIYEEQMAETENIVADTVIVAIGQGPQAAVLSNVSIERNDRGLVTVDSNGKTNMKGVFAAGDIVTGPRTVVEAVAFAKKVADEITNYCLN